MLRALGVIAIVVIVLFAIWVLAVVGRVPQPTDCLLFLLVLGFFLGLPALVVGAILFVISKVRGAKELGNADSANLRGGQGDRPEPSSPFGKPQG